MTTAAGVRVGPLIRDWRRRLSQLGLALEAGVSARHLSFVETGRSRPSAGLVLTLAEQLDVPLRDRNRLLLAAGHAPVYEQRALDDPEMAPVRNALDLILAGHEPYPALVVDDAWEMLAANRAVALLTEGVAPELLAPPLNVLRVSLHPDGVAPRIANLGEWRAHVFERLERQIAVSGDAALETLLDELRAYPGPDAPRNPSHDIAVPLRVTSPAGGTRLHQHRLHLRHRGRDHCERAVDRSVLPGRRADRRGGADAARPHFARRGLIPLHLRPIRKVGEQLWKPIRAP